MIADRSSALLGDCLTAPERPDRIRVTRGLIAGRAPLYSLRSSMSPARNRKTTALVSRRSLIKTLGAAAGAAVAGPAFAQQGQRPAPPSTVTTPPRDFGPGAAPATYFTDPD